jgi:beta-lactamase superfamily II metal-dependent hydrolase
MPLRTVLLLAGIAWAALAQKPGDGPPKWSVGALEIHHINTGRGNATLAILPDGTTLLIDAGTADREDRVTPPRPNGSRRPGEWIARYLARTLPDGKTLNYALLTHFHGDHMGSVRPDSPPSKQGPYKLAGVTDVAEQIDIRKVIDRNWPDYDFPSPLKGATMDNYRAFLKWRRERAGMTVERFAPGRADQIVLVKNPKAYPTFQVRNIAANGEVWTGVGVATRQHFPPLAQVPREDWPSENPLSIVLRLSLGAFDYYSGGDITGLASPGGPPWHDVETPVAKAVGPVEVALLNHHGYHDTTNEFFLEALRPRVDILHVWSPSHPGPRVLGRLLSTRLYPGPRDIFATNVMDVTREFIGDAVNRIKGRGHIVVRVAAGGASYQVLVLDDSDESCRVKEVYGPYESR